MNITRCSNNYGLYQFPEKLISLIINNYLNKRTLSVYGDGLNIRDRRYVEHRYKAIDIHIVKTIIRYINENVNSSVTEDLIIYMEDRKGHDRRYGIGATKIREELGWESVTVYE
jgi:dTDP-glucose 4,6-dehydratase